MRTIADIYKEYRTPPWLQAHQLRVAAVGKFVAENCGLALDEHSVISACLLHDIGAIVKFDLSDQAAALNDLYPPDQLEYWRGVQADFRAQYGEIEHPATDAILAEIGVPNVVREIVHNTGFKNVRRMLDARDMNVLTVQYADMRVGPYGIVSLDERLADVKVRYAVTLQNAGWFDRFDENIANAHETEDMLFAAARARPEECTDESSSNVMQTLAHHPIF